MNSNTGPPSAPVAWLNVLLGAKNLPVVLPGGIKAPGATCAQSLGGAAVVLQFLKLPKLVLLVLKPNGVRLSLLKMLNAFALSSKPAFSPNTRILGNVNRLPKDMSNPVYRGPRKEFLPTPGIGIEPLLVISTTVKYLVSQVKNVGIVHWLGRAQNTWKFPPPL